MATTDNAPTGTPASSPPPPSHPAAAGNAPTVEQVLQAYRLPAARRRALLTLLRALNSDMTGGG